MPKVIKDVNAKSCLVVLAYHHNKETGLCCPSISTIADEMGVRSLNTVRKAIGVLIEMNLLTMSREFGDRGEILSTRYTLNLQSEAFKPVKKKKGEAHDVKEGGSPNEGGVVHLVKGGGSSREGGVVHVVKEGGSRGEGGVVHVVNPNKEIEQGKEQGTGTGKGTRNSLPERTLWETDLFDNTVKKVDHFDNTVKKVEKPKATRAKPKTSCPFSPDDPIPPEYLEYAQAKHPSINAQTEFTKFVNFHISKDNKFSNWLAAWRTWATKAEEFAKSRPQSQSYTPARRSTDPQAGWVSTQTPTNPPPLYTPEEREAMKKKYQAMTAIFAKTDKNV